jgi:hypothetical protein
MIRDMFLIGLASLLAAPATANWQMSEFMISVWGGPSDDPKPDGHDAPVELIEAANLQVVMCKLDQLEVCRQHGLKALLFGATPEMARKLRDDEAVWGYFIKDEPWKPEEYPALAERIEAFREADPRRPAYVNLGGSYQKTHPTFLDVVKPDLLSYDYYQWSWGQDKHFSRLEEYRAAALAAGVPLLIWAHGNAGPPEMREKDYHYHAPDNLQRMRHSVFTSLAYGAKGVQWFHGGHLWDATKLRPCGRDVAEINAELAHIGRWLVRLRSADVFHTPPLPSDTRPVPDDYWVQPKGDDWVLGTLKNPQNVDYLLLVNRDHTCQRWAVLQLLRPMGQVEKLDKQTGEWVTLPTSGRLGAGTVEFIIGAGDGELLRFA